MKEILLTTIQIFLTGFYVVIGMYYYTILSNSNAELNDTDMLFMGSLIICAWATVMQWLQDLKT